MGRLSSRLVRRHAPKTKVRRVTPGSASMGKGRRETEPAREGPGQAALLSAVGPPRRVQSSRQHRSGRPRHTTRGSNEVQSLCESVRSRDAVQSRAHRRHAPRPYLPRCLQQMPRVRVPATVPIIRRSQQFPWSGKSASSPLRHVAPFGAGGRQTLVAWDREHRTKFSGVMCHDSVYQLFC